MQFFDILKYKSSVIFELDNLHIYKGLKQKSPQLPIQ